jgi:hypothetical protein
MSTSRQNGRRPVSFLPCSRAMFASADGGAGDPIRDAETVEAELMQVRIKDVFAYVGRPEAFSLENILRRGSSGSRSAHAHDDCGSPIHPAEAALVLLFGATTYSAWLTHIVDCAEDRLWASSLPARSSSRSGSSTAQGYGWACGNMWPRKDVEPNQPIGRSWMSAPRSGYEVPCPNHFPAG